MKKKKITAKMSMSEVLASNEKAAEILFESGMGCVGCPMAQMESLEDGCISHGMSKKDIDEIVDKLNK